MRPLLSAIAVVALTSPALAIEAIDWCVYNVPPLEYQYEPSQQYMISDWPHEMLGAMCSADGGGMRWAREGNHGGCIVIDSQDDFAFIYVLAGLSPEQRECVIVHEKAHLNGWLHGPSPSYLYYADEAGNYRPQRGPFRRRP